MTSDHTEFQSTGSKQTAKELSLKRTAPPTEVPGYETQRFLGSGAFGEVWVGVDQNTGRRVAIKFYTHRGGVDWTLLSREVEKLAVLSADRYVVQLLDVGWDSDPPYYVMDYIENGSLEDLLKREGPLPLRDAYEIFHEVSVGLMHLHGKGVLHCDLKPANVLLDEDQKPRLADFGQSRLTHEQSPALGTLFYMAPEQADQKAVPDARWDVYALGALLYCMLTGEPPFRSEELLDAIESTNSLKDRLDRYRTMIQTAPRPAGHRRIRGIDSELVEIIDRCLAVNPEHRYASVQSVLEAMVAREAARTRNPLIGLGFVGPLILLLVMAVFGWRGYEAVKDRSTNEVRRRAFESNLFAAQSIAGALESEIEHIFEIVASEAQEPQLIDQVNAVSQSASFHALGSTESPGDQFAARQSSFLEDPQRDELKRYLQSRLDAQLERRNQFTHAPRFASVFVVDKSGVILASVYDEPSIKTKSVGRNYAWRTYFHGGPVDLPRDARPPEVQHIESTHLSAAFQSTTTNTWKVAVSTPIEDQDGSFVGVMVFTVSTGDFAFLQREDKTTDGGDDQADSSHDRFAVLIDPRRGKEGATILQHQQYDKAGTMDDTDAPAVDYSLFRVTRDQLRAIQEKTWQHRYRDPVAGENAPDDWIAAIALVHAPNGTPRPGEPDLIVLVQENEAAVTGPLGQLGSYVVKLVLQALGAAVLTVVILWTFVIRTLRGVGRLSQYTLPGRSLTRSLHSMDTVAAPNGPSGD